MQEGTIITYERILDEIVLEREYQYSVYTTLGLTPQEDYYIKLDFINLDDKTIVDVANLYKQRKALQFSSVLAKRESYQITHIVVVNMSATSQYTMVWECLSDDPGMSLIKD